MGSRIMHAIIANRIAENLSIEDRTSFLVGSVAPDAVSTKNESHFFKGEVQDYTRYIEYQEFLVTYQSERTSPYVLGYYTHLIADDIWLRGFNLPWLRNRMEADPHLYDVSHQDFRSLNGKLLEHYGCADELKRLLSHVPDIVDLEEVKREDVDAFIPYVLGDMEYDKETINEDLRLFTMVQIIGYIETSVELGIMKLEPILGKQRIL
ncbi:zinc dependent phospholipase C family protein [Paenibacillus solani]|uniref:zinc dependent phospholipase C family protein n=1 Tax=Paenibacillus solani TaxID=1705565 RepID=UPI003D26E5B1